MALPCIKRIHGNFVHFAPPPIRQVFGKLAHCVRSNSASNLPAMLTKWTKLPYPNAYYTMEGAISTVLDMSHKKCRTYVQSPSYMKTAYWFAPTFFIVNNVESRRCTLQNKHLFENP